MQFASKKSEILKEIVKTREILKDFTFSLTCKRHKENSIDFLCRNDGRPLCNYCVNDHCINSFCLIVPIKYLKLKMKEELNLLEKYLSFQNNIRMKHILSTISKLENYLKRINLYIAKIKNLKFEYNFFDELNLNFIVKYDIHKKLRQKAHSTDKKNMHKTGNYFPKNIYGSDFENFKIENLNLNNRNLFSKNSCSLEKKNSERKFIKGKFYKCSNSLIFEKSLENDFKNKNSFSNEKLEPNFENSFMKISNLTEKSNFVNYNEKIRKKSTSLIQFQNSKIKVEEEECLESICITEINGFLNEAFLQKLSYEIPLYLDQKYESRFKKTAFSYKEAIKKILFEREANEKIYYERKNKKKQNKEIKYYDNNESESNESLNFYKHIKDSKNKKIRSPYKEQLKKILHKKFINEISFQEKIFKKENKEKNNIEEMKINSKKSENYFKKFKKILNEKFLLLKQEGDQSDYFIEEKEFLWGSAKNKITEIKKFRLNDEKLENNNILSSDINKLERGEKDCKDNLQIMKNINFKTIKFNKDKFENNKANDWNNKSLDFCNQKNAKLLNKSNFIISNNKILNNISDYDKGNNENSEKETFNLCSKNPANSYKDLIKINIGTFNLKKDVLTETIDNYKIDRSIELIDQINNNKNSSQIKFDNKKLERENKNIRIENNNLENLDNFKVFEELKRKSYELNKSNVSHYSQESNSSENSNPRKIKIFADSDLDQNLEIYNRVNCIQNLTKDQDFPKKENLSTQKKSKMHIKDLNEGYLKDSNENEEKSNRKLSNLFIKKFKSGEKLKIENPEIKDNRNVNDFICRKSISPNKNKNLDIQNIDDNIKDSDINQNYYNINNIKSNIFTRNSDNNNQKEEISINETIDLNNPKADFINRNNYCILSKEENNLIENTNIEEQSNIKNIIMALDSRILKSSVQQKNIDPKLNLSKNKGKNSSDNENSNCSKISNDTFIIHLVDDENSEEDDIKNKKFQKNGLFIKQSIRKNSHSKDADLICKDKLSSSNLIEQKNNDFDNSKKKKESAKNNTLNNNNFLLNANKMIEEAKKKKLFTTMDSFIEKKLKNYDTKNENESKKNISSPNNLINSPNINAKLNIDLKQKLEVQDTICSKNISSNQYLDLINKSDPFINNNQSNIYKNLTQNNPDTNKIVNSLNEVKNINSNNNYSINNLNGYSNFNNMNGFVNNGINSEKNLKNISENNKVKNSQIDLGDQNNPQKINLLLSLLYNQNPNNIINKAFNNTDNNNVNINTLFNSLINFNYGQLNNAFNLGNPNFPPNNLNLLYNEKNSSNLPNSNIINNLSNYNNNHLFYLIQQLPNSQIKDAMMCVLNSKNIANLSLNSQNYLNNNYINNNQTNSHVESILNMNKNSNNTPQNFNNFPNNNYNQFNLSNNNSFPFLNNNLLFQNKNFINNNMSQINHQNQMNIPNNKDYNFGTNNNNIFNLQSQLRLSLNENNINNLNTAPNLLNNFLWNNYLQNNNQSFANPSNLNLGNCQNSDFNLNNRDKNSDLNLNNNLKNSDLKLNNIKETDTEIHNNNHCYKTKDIDENSNSNKIKISSLLSDKNIYKSDITNNFKTSSFVDK